MNLKNLKQKVVRNLPEITLVTSVAAVVTAMTIVIVKTSKDSNIPTTIRNAMFHDGISGSIDPNFLHDLIGEAKETSIQFVTDKDFIIFLSK